jgi:hypothetical protein
MDITNSVVEDDSAGPLLCQTSLPIIFFWKYMKELDYQEKRQTSDKSRGESRTVLLV